MNSGLELLESIFGERDVNLYDVRDIPGRRHTFELRVKAFGMMFIDRVVVTAENRTIENPGYIPDLCKKTLVDKMIRRIRDYANDYRQEQ